MEQQQVVKAVKALLKHVEIEKHKNSNKSVLIEEDDTILLIIGLTKIPDTYRAKPLPIPIPHPLLPEDASVCIFVKDPQNEFKTLFASQNFPVKVIGLTKLRKNYKQYEDKRKLCGSYDFFVADNRIITMLPSLLGKTFFKKKKQPIPVDVSVPDKAVQNIKKAMQCTYLHRTSGACMAIKIAKTSHSQKEVVENIMEGMKIIIEKIPHKWKGVQSVHIKSTNSIALPIYATLPVFETLPEGADAIEGEKMDIETAGKKESKDKVTPTKEKKEKKDKMEVTSPKAQTNEKKESKKEKETVTPSKEKKESKKAKVESATPKTPETKKDSTAAASKTLTEPRKGTKKRAANEDDEAAEDKDTKKKLKKKRKSI